MLILREMTETFTTLIFRVALQEEAHLQMAKWGEGDPGNLRTNTLGDHENGPVKSTTSMFSWTLTTGITLFQIKVDC